MKRILCATILAAVFGTMLHAADDKRLVTMKKVYVTPVDDLGVDKPISVCLKRHLADETSLEAVDSADGADVVFRVSGNLPSATTRVVMGVMGGTPSAHLFIELPDGTKLWDDGAKLRRTMMGKDNQFGKLSSADGDKGVECGLADELLGTLRNAMRKARDRK